jgi:hypothetical protein
VQGEKEREEEKNSWGSKTASSKCGNKRKDSSSVATDLITNINLSLPRETAPV